MEIVHRFGFQRSAF